ncbi:hypothetical protein GGR51DRAFT_567296 [Nemania sp. FL0031]|nr:hypothetical protein GGR51DRAFT_567296 [Nemania sp. FL0031]
MSKIENAPEDVVRAILIGLCQDPNQEQKAMEHFMKLDGLKSRELVKSGDILYESTEESRNDSRINGIGGKKRRALTEILMCAKFVLRFINSTLLSRDIRKNDESSVWDDWEDWRQGDPYSKENRKEYPEGYIWQCCKKDNTNAGCMTGPHARILLGTAFHWNARVPCIFGWRDLQAMAKLLRVGTDADTAGLLDAKRRGWDLRFVIVGAAALVLITIGLYRDAPNLHFSYDRLRAQYYEALTGSCATPKISPYGRFPAPNKRYR